MPGHKKTRAGTKSAVLRVHVPEPLLKDLKGKTPKEASAMIGGALTPGRRPIDPELRAIITSQPTKPLSEEEQTRRKALTSLALRRPA